MPFIIGAAVVGSTLVGGLISSSANASAADKAASGQEQAAQINADAQKQAAQITADANAAALDKQLAFNKQAQDEYRAASGRGIGDITQGVSDYTGTVTPLLTPAPITLPTYRGLTAQQQTGEADMLRNANATLASSNLRGAGRAGVGAVLDQDRRFHEDAAAANDASTLSAKQAAQGVSNSARVGLAGIQAAAGGSKANTELLTGNQLGNSLTGSGSQAAALTQATGNAGANAAANSGLYSAKALSSGADTQAAAEIANGRIASSTLGSLAGTFSNPNLYSGGGGGGGGYFDNTSGFDVPAPA